MSTEVIALLITALSGAGGLIAFLRLKGDNALTIVSASEKAVLVQSGVITDLDKRLDAVERQAAAAEKRATAAEARAEELAAERDALLVRAEQAEAQNRLLVRANDEMRERLDQIERRMAEIDHAAE